VKAVRLALLVLGSAALAGVLTYKATTVTPTCRVPFEQKGDKPAISIDEQAREACLEMGALSFRPPNLDVAALTAGHQWGPGFEPDALLQCRFASHRRSGDTSKFRCHRTEAAAFVDRKGQRMPQATAVDDRGYLLDGKGVRIRQADGDGYSKADRLRVKYTTGKPRDREVFTEVAASRLLWALGFYSDAMYPARVHCEGCKPDPYAKRQDEPDPGSRHSFFPASVERKIPGKEVELRSDQGWSLKELRGVYDRGSLNRKVEIEAFLVALNLIGLHNALPFQNRLTCLDDGWKRQTGLCFAPVLYVQDLGSTFGRRVEVGTHSRGDFSDWQPNTLFADRANCRIRHNFGQWISVSEEARAFLWDRSQVLTEDKVRAIFRLAHFEQVDPELRAQLEQQGIAGAALDEAVLGAWTGELMKRLDELRTARCPSLLALQTGG